MYLTYFHQDWWCSQAAVCKTGFLKVGHEDIRGTYVVDEVVTIAEAMSCFIF